MAGVSTEVISQSTTNTAKCKCINVNVGVGAQLPFVPGCIDCGQSDNGSLISRHRPAQPCPARTLPQHLAPQISISFVVMLWYIGIQRDTHRDTCALVWPIYLPRRPAPTWDQSCEGWEGGYSYIDAHLLMFWKVQLRVKWCVSIFQLN